MPRVENVGKNVDYWYDNEGDGSGSSTFDVCASCYADLCADPHAYDEELSPYNGDPDGDAGREGDVCHPSYGWDDSEYECEACGVELTEDDD